MIDSLSWLRYILKQQSVLTKKNSKIFHNWVIKRLDRFSKISVKNDLIIFVLLWFWFKKIRIIFSLKTQAISADLLWDVKVIYKKKVYFDFDQKNNCDFLKNPSNFTGESQEETSFGVRVDFFRWPTNIIVH